MMIVLSDISDHFNRVQNSTYIPKCSEKVRESPNLWVHACKHRVGNFKVMGYYATEDFKFFSQRNPVVWISLAW